MERAISWSPFKKEKPALGYTLLFLFYLFHNFTPSIRVWFSKSGRGENAAVAAGERGHDLRWGFHGEEQELRQGPSGAVNLMCQAFKFKISTRILPRALCFCYWLDKFYPSSALRIEVLCSFCKCCEVNFCFCVAFLFPSSFWQLLSVFSASMRVENYSEFACVEGDLEEDLSLFILFRRDIDLRNEPEFFLIL